MRLYNTLNNKLEEFVPNSPDVVKMYTCGPTVYSYAHIGNLRTYISEDVLEKSLEYLGYNVKRCMNITDVGHLVSDADTGDDKMLVAAEKEHKSVLDLAEFYTNKFFSDCTELNIKKPEIISKATDNIEEYIKIITKLIKDGYAYFSGGNVYFNTSSYPDYYKLSNRKKDDLVSSCRVDVDTNKKNPEDFVLWFTDSKFNDQALKWDSPWGVGYPGWHIECTGISIKYLGEDLDIHCGAIDAVFPHHTNEIAQSECYLGHKWCNYWVHLEFLNDKNGKMSKSKGDFLTLDVLKNNGYKPIEYRYFCLNSSYRNQLVFTFDALDQAKIGYKKLLNKVSVVKDGLGLMDNKEVEKYDSEFKNCLSNNLNTSSALTVLYDVLKSDNSNATKLELVKRFDKVLSLDLLLEDNIDNNFEKYILEKIEQRNNAKAIKDFVLADRIRDELKSKGIEIKDTREGTSFIKI